MTSTLLLCLVIIPSALAQIDVVETEGGFAEGELTLTPQDKDRIVRAHNDIRRNKSASDMLQLEWHEGLATEAATLTAGCEWSRTPPDQLTGLVTEFSQLGEIIHVTPTAVQLRDLVGTWSEEMYNYDYDSNQCNKVCWHYTQLVTAKVHSIGCSVRFCPRLELVTWGQNGGFLVSCLYGPGGVMDGGRPFSRSGDACTGCDAEFPYCVDRLCSKNEAPSTTPQPSTVKSTTMEATTLSSKPITTTVETAASHRPSSSSVGVIALVFILFLI